MTMNVSWPRENTIYTLLAFSFRNIASPLGHTALAFGLLEIQFILYAHSVGVQYMYIYIICMRCSFYRRRILIYYYVYIYRSIEYVRGGDVYRATSRVISYTSIYYYYYIHTTTSFCPTEARPQMLRCHLTIASGQTGSDTRASGGNIVESLSFSRRSI